MGLSLPHDIVNDTTADAAPVQSNYQVIEDYVNAEVITRDGNVGMTAPLLLVGDPTQPLHAATKSYVDLVLPVGIILPFGGTTIPSASWAMCNGAALSITEYSTLHDAIGDAFNIDGTPTPGTFLLPNMNGKMPVGVWPDSGGTVFDADCNLVGESGGTTTPPMRQHSHPFNHGHIAQNTGVQQSSHTHDMAHNHGSFPSTAELATHRHNINAKANSAAGTGPYLMLAGATGSIVDAITDGATPVHTHTVDVPALPATQTGVQSGDHSHSVTINTSTGYVTQAMTGTLETKYRPPYVTVSFIIRVR